MGVSVTPSAWGSTRKTPVPPGSEAGVRIRVASAANGTPTLTPLSRQSPADSATVAGRVGNGAEGSCSAAVSTESPAATGGSRAAR
ncbi:hypothetical protein SD37_13415 [Amycolatopsis orientalis]|uniref:Uncharacterized protein n=1 Tax=Amycolatopsis orientalis TaxID=31958 RepID=A0A193BWL4_AMYOR|nr:hypothetical protein SD37_13415 [Amycolatopsis orientalis]